MRQDASDYKEEQDTNLRHNHAEEVRESSEEVSGCFRLGKWAHPGDPEAENELMQQDTLFNSTGQLLLLHDCCFTISLGVLPLHAAYIPLFPEAAMVHWGQKTVKTWSTVQSVECRFSATMYDPPQGRQLWNSFYLILFWFFSSSQETESMQVAVPRAGWIHVVNPLCQSFNSSHCATQLFRNLSICWKIPHLCFLSHESFSYLQPG